MENERKKDGKHVVNITDVLKTLKGRTIPIIPHESTVEEAIETIAQFPHSRLLYVVDAEEKFIGTISLGNLVRHFFSRSHEPQIHPRSLINMITTETAKDIMETHPIFATGEEDVELVLKRMVEKNVKEIAVLDGENRLIGDVTMIDLLQFLIKAGRKKS